MSIYLLYLFLTIINYCNSYKLAILGASSNLAREIIFQGINERHMDIIGLSSQKRYIYYPYRNNKLNYSQSDNIIKSNKLELDNYWAYPYYDYQHLIITTRSIYTQKDYTQNLILKFIDNLSPSCRSISFISQTNNLNIFKSQNSNEEKILINKCPNDIKTFIYQPVSLSYGQTFLNTRSRQHLAKEILDDIELLNYKYYR